MCPVATANSNGASILAAFAPYRSKILLAIGLATLTALVFGSVRHFDFVDYDDDVYVTKNLGVLQGVTPESIQWAFTATDSNHWHPLTWLSLQRDAEQYATGDGLKAGGFHLTNLLLHIGNVLLLFAVLVQMTNLPYRSAVVAALFAVHPLHVESVAWVTERKDVLSTLFWLLTTVAYVQYARRPDWQRSALVLFAYVLGLLAKPMLISLPFTLLLLDYWPLQRFSTSPSSPEPIGNTYAPVSGRWLVAEKLPLLLFAVLSGAVSLTARQINGGVKSKEYIDLAERLACAVNAYAVYPVKMLWPANLAPFYALPPEGFSKTLVAIEAALLVGVTLAVLAVRRHRPYLAVGWLWYLVTLLPVSGVVQLGSYRYADRYTYVPSIGLFVGLVWWVAELVARPWRLRVLLPATAGVLLGASVLSWQQVRIWRDSVALWEHTLQVAPDHYIVRTHLGKAYQNTGRFDAAEAELTRALAMRPDLALTHGNLGLLRQSQGRLQDAEAYFLDALRLDPGSALYRFHLAATLEQMKKKGPQTRKIESADTRKEK